MAMSTGGGKGGPTADINMTPMIDVLLVLIIIFMVINPPDSKGLDALAPQPPPPNQQQDDSRAVVVTVGKDRSVMVNQEVSNFNDLGTRLTEIFKTRAEKVAFVKGEPETEFQLVAQAIDIAKGAGVEKVGIMTPKIEAGE